MSHRHITATGLTPALRQHGFMLVIDCIHHIELLYWLVASKVFMHKSERICEGNVFCNKSNDNNICTICVYLVINTKLKSHWHMHFAVIERFRQMRYHPTTWQSNLSPIVLPRHFWTLRLGGKLISFPIGDGDPFALHSQYQVFRWPVK